MSRRLLNSLRFRLMVLFILAVGLIQAVLGVGGVLLRQGAVWAELERERAVYSRGEMAEARREAEEEITFLWKLLGLAMLGGLVAAGVGAWVFTTWAANRLNLVTRLTREIDPAHLDRRLKEDGQGDEISTLVGTLNTMLERIEASFKAQDRFVAEASHELRTPIAVVLGEAQAALRDQADGLEAHHQFAGSVQAEMRRLATMVDSLMTLTRTGEGQAGEGELELRGDVWLHEAVVEAVQRVGAASGAVFHVTLPDPAATGRDPVVRGDASLLAVMFDAVLRAAVQRSSPSRKPGVALAVEGDAAVVRVQPDNGGGNAGVSESELLIADRIARVHGGTIKPRDKGWEVRLPLVLE